jgi:hypothetical protein
MTSRAIVTNNEADAYEVFQGVIKQKSSSFKIVREV